MIVPSFTFVTTALAFVRAGATIRFADIEPETLGIDPTSVEALMDDSVKAIVPVHYAGVGCRIDELNQTARGRADIIEDNAHGLFGRIGDRKLGSFGRMSTLSFHETKNFTCGEGGALVLNHDGDIDRAHVLLDKGTESTTIHAWRCRSIHLGRHRFIVRVVRPSTRPICGLNSRSGIPWNWRAYSRGCDDALSPRQEQFNFRCPIIPVDRHPAWHMYYLVVESRRRRDALLAHLAGDGINATFHFVPLHSSPAGLKVSDRESHCPVSDDMSGRLIRLPLFYDLKPSDQDRVCESVLEFFEHGMR